jgi:uncharacterized protein (TIGR03382 family)
MSCAAGQYCGPTADDPARYVCVSPGRGGCSSSGGGSRLATMLALLVVARRRRRDAEARRRARCARR